MMKRFHFFLLISLFLVGCQTTVPSAPIVEQVPVPVPFCPAPPDYMNSLQKQGGLDYITADSPPGEVAKHWHYEVEYLRGLNEIQHSILEAYRQNGGNLEQLEADIQRIINETNTNLRETRPPAQ
jgi:hypothetical protein